MERRLRIIVKRHPETILQCVQMALTRHRRDLQFLALSESKNAESDFAGLVAQLVRARP